MCSVVVVRNSSSLLSSKKKHKRKKNCAGHTTKMQLQWMETEAFKTQTGLKSFINVLHTTAIFQIFQSHIIRLFEEQTRATSATSSNFSFCSPEESHIYLEQDLVWVNKDRLIIAEWT